MTQKIHFTLTRWGALGWIEAPSELKPRNELSRNTSDNKLSISSKSDQPRTKTRPNRKRKRRKEWKKFEIEKSIFTRNARPNRNCSVEFRPFQESPTDRNWNWKFPQGFDKHGPPITGILASRSAAVRLPALGRRLQTDRLPFWGGGSIFWTPSNSWIQDQV